MPALLKPSLLRFEEILRSFYLLRFYDLTREIRYREGRGVTAVRNFVREMQLRFGLVELFGDENAVKLEWSNHARGMLDRQESAHRHDVAQAIGGIDKDIESKLVQLSESLLQGGDFWKSFTLFLMFGVQLVKECVMGDGFKDPFWIIKMHIEIAEKDWLDKVEEKGSWTALRQYLQGNLN